MSYFIRHTNNPEADLQRGFSFVGYQLFTEREAALYNLADVTGEMYEDEDFDLAAWSDDNDHRVGQDNVTRMWGTRRSGLCAYGEYESLEDALEALREGDYAAAAGGDFTEFTVVFEGVRTFNQELDSQDEGITFKPSRIAHREGR
jgi:hypothetical protein